MGGSEGSRRVEWREHEGGVEEQEGGVEGAGRWSGGSRRVELREQEGVKWPCCCWSYELPDLFSPHS